MSEEQPADALVEVIQADRDAAAEYLAAIVPSMPRLAASVASGQTALARAFSGHRITHQADSAALRTALKTIAEFPITDPMENMDAYNMQTIALRALSTAFDAPFDAAQFAYDQQSDDPQPGDWNDACLRIAEGITRNTTPSDGAIYAALSAKVDAPAVPDGDLRENAARLCLRAMFACDFTGDSLCDEADRLFYRPHPRAIHAVTLADAILALAASPQPAPAMSAEAMQDAIEQSLSALEESAYSCSACETCCGPVKAVNDVHAILSAAIRALSTSGDE